MLKHQSHFQGFNYAVAEQTSEHFGIDQLTVIILLFLNDAVAYEVQARALGAAQQARRLLSSPTNKKTTTQPMSFSSGSSVLRPSPVKPADEWSTGGRVPSSGVSFPVLQMHSSTDGKRPHVQLFGDGGGRPPPGEGGGPPSTIQNTVSVARDHAAARRRRESAEFFNMDADDSSSSEHEGAGRVRTSSVKLAAYRQSTTSARTDYTGSWASRSSAQSGSSFGPASSASTSTSSSARGGYNSTSWAPNSINSAVRQQHSSSSTQQLQHPSLGPIRPISASSERPSHDLPSVVSSSTSHYKRFDEDSEPDTPLPPCPVGGSPVFVHVYDVSQENFIKKLNRWTANKKSWVKLGGIFHAGVEVFNLEWSYGATCTDTAVGVACNEPKQHPQHRYRQTVFLGYTMLTNEDVAELLGQFIEEYPGDDYDLFRRNCCHFADEMCAKLGVGSIPGWIHRFAKIASGLDTAYTAVSGVWSRIRGERGSSGESDDDRRGPLPVPDSWIRR